jgi:hypothetical protein
LIVDAVTYVLNRIRGVNGNESGGCLSKEPVKVDSTRGYSNVYGSEEESERAAKIVARSLETKTSPGSHGGTDY